MVWLLLAASAWAMDTDDARRRFHFAEMYLGGDARLLAPSGTTVPATVAPRFWIGATHFWGHADFYVAFQLPGEQTVGGGSPSSAGVSVETGGKLYPWALQPQTVRPWVGAALAPISYVDGEGPLAEQNAALLTAGVAARHKAHIVEAGAGWMPPTTFAQYPTAPDERDDVTLSAWTASLRYKYSFDTTIVRIGSVRSGRLEREQAAVDAVGGLELAVGPSSSFPIGQPSGSAIDGLDYVGKSPGSIFPELGAGCYFRRLDAAARIAWRSLGAQATAHGAQRQWQRHAASAEAFKMLFDYHGFVPFVGPGVSVNWLAFSQEGPDTPAQEWRSLAVTPELVFGWDIRPTEAEWFLLRTNLRWAPWLSLSEEDAQISFRAVDFNFIQMVVYPQRIRAHRRLSQEEGA